MRVFFTCVKKMEVFEFLDSVLNITGFFPDIDRELIVFAFNPRGYHRVPERMFDRLKVQYGILEKHNKILEFVGDSVLDMVAMKRLLDLYSLTLRPIQYHQIHKYFVNNENLTVLSQDLGICDQLFPSEKLVRDGDWHNSCSNSMEALLGAIYIQFPNIDRIVQWFFSLKVVSNNFDRIVRSIVPPTLPQIQEWVPPLESTFSALNIQSPPSPPPTVQSPPSPPPTVQLRIIREPKILPTVRILPRGTSRFIEKNQAVQAINSSNDYLLVPRSTAEYYPDHIRSIDIPPSEELRWVGIEEELPSTGGKIPNYSIVYSSPENGWWGYYFQINAVEILLSDLVPSQEEFRIAREYLAAQALSTIKITGYEELSFIGSSFHVENVESSFRNVPIMFGIRLTPVGDDSKTSLVSCLNYSIQTKRFSPGTKMTVQQTLRNWDVSFLQQNQDNFSNYIDAILAASSGVMKLTFGRLNLYSNFYKIPAFGFSVRNVENRIIQEIPLSYIMTEQNALNYREMLAVQMFEYLRELGIFSTDLSNVTIIALRNPDLYVNEIFEET
jgi:hypothetical protein